MAGVGPFIEVSIDGLDELEKNLNALPEDLAKKALGNAARRAMRDLQNKIAAAAPVLTGKLSKGIKMRSKFIGDGAQGGTIIVSVGLQLTPEEQDVFYGKFVELGTIKMHADPFMKPTFDAGAPGVIAQFAKELDAAIEMVAKRARSKVT